MLLSLSLSFHCVVAVVVGALGSGACVWLWWQLGRTFPQSFTAAEALVLAQAQALCVAAAGARLLLPHAPWLPRVEPGSAVLLCMSWGMPLICTTTAWLRRRHLRGTGVRGEGGAVAAAAAAVVVVVMVAVPWWCKRCSTLTTRSPLLWVLHYLLLDNAQRQVRPQTLARTPAAALCCQCRGYS